MTNNAKFGKGPIIEPTSTKPVQGVILLSGQAVIEEVAKNRLDSLHLIHNSLSTILLDAIQFFPEELKRIQAESHGLLFGIPQNGILECDYVFSVGNVKSRKKDEVETNPKVDQAVNMAKQILSTSKLIGSYHSHPNTGYFKDWAEPSNGDTDYAKYAQNPCELILAISRSSKTEKPLTLEYRTASAQEYYHNPKMELHDSPKIAQAKYKFQYICGEFRKYRFEIRAYAFNGNGLQDMNLYSSEAEVLMRLLEEKIDVERLDAKGVYSVRKLEYDYRTKNQASGDKHERITQNIDYHISQLKKQMK